MRMDRATIILRQAEYKQKGMCFLLQEQEDELEASYRVVQV